MILVLTLHTRKPAILPPYVNEVLSYHLVFIIVMEIQITCSILILIRNSIDWRVYGFHSWYSHVWGKWQRYSWNYLKPGSASRLLEQFWHVCKMMVWIVVEVIEGNCIPICFANFLSLTYEHLFSFVHQYVNKSFPTDLSVDAMSVDSNRIFRDLLLEREVKVKIHVLSLQRRLISVVWTLFKYHNTSEISTLNDCYLAGHGSTTNSVRLLRTEN